MRKWQVPLDECTRRARALHSTPSLLSHPAKRSPRLAAFFHGRCWLHNMRPLSMSLRVQGQPHLLPLCLCRCHCAYPLSPRLVPEFLPCNLPRETSMPWLVNCYRSPQSQGGHEFGHGMADDQGRQLMRRAVLFRAIGWHRCAVD